MLNYMTLNQIEDLEKIKEFSELLHDYNQIIG